MCLLRSVVRWSVLAVAALALGACATQPHDEVQLSVGTQSLGNAKARDYAALYAPYAMMATAAYTNTNALTKADRCPDIRKLGTHLEGDSDEQFTFNQTVRGWIIDLNHRNWHCMSGVVGSLPCPPKLGRKCEPVGGLEFHVWRRMERGQCREVAIAFRGSDKNDRGDWISNFRWLYRLAPKFDQYYQVQTHITQVVAGIKQNGCGGAGTQFVSVGHSLGGGLAQQAAYAEDKGSIRYVYGFDPSPVTGFFDVSDLIREHSTEGLGVDRAYEQGEILTLPRLLIENIFPPAPCHPRIRSVRFNMLSGLAVQQHNIQQLTEKLRMAAHERGANPRRVDESAKARSCKDAPMLLRAPA